MLAGHVRFLAQKSPAAARRVKNDPNRSHPFPASNAGAFPVSER